MIMKDINFVGFLKLNVFLILLPSLINSLIFNVIRITNIQDQFFAIQSGDVLSQGSEDLPPVEPIPQNLEDLSPAFELFVTSAPRIIAPFILVYFLAKVVHFLAQNTRVGNIKIGNASG